MVPPEVSQREVVLDNQTEANSDKRMSRDAAAFFCFRVRVFGVFGARCNKWRPRRNKIDACVFILFQMDRPHQLVHSRLLDAQKKKKKKIVRGFAVERTYLCIRIVSAAAAAAFAGFRQRRFDRIESSTPLGSLTTSTPQACHSVTLDAPPFLGHNSSYSIPNLRNNFHPHRFILHRRRPCNRASHRSTLQRSRLAMT